MKRMIKKMFRRERINRYCNNVLKMYSNGSVALPM
jgi:hypothetical protein